MYRPKIGEECFVRSVSRTGKISDMFDEFEKVKIKYISTEGCACESVDGIDFFMDKLDYVMEFRPLKSKRDEEIDAMIDCSSVSNYATCEALYSKGYRKQMPYSQFISKIDEYLYNSERVEYHPQMASDLARAVGRTTEDAE